MHRFLTTTLLAATSLAAFSAAANATTLQISVTHNGTTPLFITPLYTAFHNGDFDPVTIGETASVGLEDLAETGRFGPASDPDTIAAQRAREGGGGVPAPVFGNAGPGPVFSPGIGPGQVGGDAGSTIVEIADPLDDRFFTFLAMILPSNDTFIANLDPIEIFGLDGSFLGPKTIVVGGDNIFDAGTETNDLSVDGGAAFVQGADISAGGVEGGTVQQALGLDFGGGIDLAPPGSDPSLAPLATLSGFFDFTASDFNLLTIEITDVTPAPVPVPASGLLLLAGIGGLVTARRRSRV
ncbi:spondin domain-containing protein [uncultured Roseobacter sp.]|uniref:spondin domain-containing protein n=1 Tax=uncultured Roseobacter sp. TaxID=114847 RepID=UPI00260539B4|nr:spondin domain-containing protein [uncultured Roseobacter sp.]